MAATRKSTGPNDMPVYQGLARIYCRDCQAFHRVIISSDDERVANALVETLSRACDRSGAGFSAVLIESTHPDTDHDMRHWGKVSDLLPF